MNLVNDFLIEIYNYFSKFIFDIFFLQYFSLIFYFSFHKLRISHQIQILYHISYFKFVQLKKK